MKDQRLIFKKTRFPILSRNTLLFILNSILTRAQITKTKSKLGDIDYKWHEFANLKTYTMELEVVEDPSSTWFFKTI
jgi:hypothetical protein